MKMLKDIIIEGSKNKQIGLDVFYKEDNKQKPIVIFVHGFKGFKDWGHFNLVASTFAEHDFVFVKFNFSHNGTTPLNPLEFGDLEAFGNNNYIIELDDLKLVMDWVLSGRFLASEINKEQLYLLGHSRGGGISILKACEDKRVKKLVTWASVSDFINRNKKRTIETWQKDGVVFAHNARTGQQMPLYLQFYESLVANKERLNILKAAKNLSIPFLIVHGTADEAVDVHDAKQLHITAKHSKLFLVEGASHTFGARHPFVETSLPQDAKNVIEKTILFLK
ncbi:MAG: alpha/beta hydrolase family protein [Bacteroidia bacterium]